MRWVRRTRTSTRGASRLLATQRGHDALHCGHASHARSQGCAAPPMLGRHVLGALRDAPPRAHATCQRTHKHALAFRSALPWRCGCRAAGGSPETVARAAAAEEGAVLTHAPRTTGADPKRSARATARARRPRLQRNHARRTELAIRVACAAASYILRAARARAAPRSFQGCFFFGCERECFFSQSSSFNSFGCSAR